MAMMNDKQTENKKRIDELSPVAREIFQTLDTTMMLWLSTDNTGPLTKEDLHTGINLFQAKYFESFEDIPSIFGARG